MTATTQSSPGMQALFREAEQTKSTITAMAAPTQRTGHTLGVRLISTSVVLTIHCHEPDTAHCRRVGEGAQDIDIPECNAAAWMGKHIPEYIEWPESGEPDYALTDGMPITVIWDTDTWIWHPTQEAANK